MTEENKQAEPAKPDLTAEQKAAETAKTLDFNLTQRIDGVIRDVLENKLTALEKALDEKIETILKGKEIEMEAALRKGFGLDNDPVIHQSDLVAAIRKAQLTEADTDKRTPAPDATTKSAGPEGNAPELTALEKAVKQFEEAT